MQDIKKQIVRTAVNAVILIGVLTACSETEEQIAPAEKQEAKKITILASRSEANKTRMAYAEKGEEEKVIKAYWTSRDVFLVFTDTESVQKGILFNNNNDAKTEEEEASFSGSIIVEQGDECHAFYPSSNKNADKETWKGWVMSAQAQSQTGNGSTSHLSKYDYMTGEFTYDKSINNELVFKREMALIKFVLTLPSDREPSDVPLKIILSSKNDSFYSEKGVVSKADGGAGDTKTKSVSLLLNGMEEFDSPLTAYMMLIPVTLTNEELTLAVECTKSIYTATISNVSVSYEAGHYYTAEMSTGWTKSERTVITFDNNIAEMDELYVLNNIEFNVGDGETEETAYEIHTAQELKRLVALSRRSYDAYRNKYFKLKADVHVTADIWTTIGSQFNEDEFVGYFDGEDHIITGELKGGTTVSTQGTFGFFGKIFGEIKNLHNRATITSDSYNIGGIAGCIGQSGSITSKIENCTNAGAITGKYQVGGILGYANSAVSISGCTNTGNIKGTQGQSNGAFIGGIVGGELNNYFISVNNCINKGSITIESAVKSGTHLYIGGIAGSARSVVDCENQGNVTATLGEGMEGYAVGGIVGAVKEISGSTNKGIVTSTAYCGGIAGYCKRYNADDETYSITKCINEGEVNGTTAVGGIMGVIEYSPSFAGIACSVTGCANTGTITGTDNYVGGIVGRDYYGGTNKGILSIESCTNSGEIHSNNYAGGILGGISSNATVFHKNHNSSTIIKIGTTGKYVGTICGTSFSISDCNTSVEVTDDSGNLIGLSAENRAPTECEDPTHFE